MSLPVAIANNIYASWDIVVTRELGISLLLAVDWDTLGLRF
jgi:hypothetical protein